MQKPNVLFVLIDDLGYKDLSCYGSTFYETPNIDNLSKEGIRFTNAYAACPVCSPTRASILSGKYPARIGITDWIDHTRTFHPLKGKLIDAKYRHNFPHNEISIAQKLKENGYSTWHVGKWHLGDSVSWPKKLGFDINIGGSQYGHPANGYFSPYNLPNIDNGKKDEYLTDRLTKEAINLIENHNSTKPFFLNLWHYAVHTPIEAPKELTKKYIAKKAKMNLDNVKEFSRGEPFKTEDKKGKHVIRRLVQSDPKYAAMIENLDTNLGKIFDALKKKGLYENTLIIFTSDNGGLSTTEGSPTCNLPLFEGKGWMYEGGVREPLIVKWSGRIAKDSITDEYISSPDFYPTILEAAGIDLDYSQHCDGISFLNLLEGKDFSRGPIYWHYPHYGNQGGSPGSSIRWGKYKLIEFYENKKVELYDLEHDIGETNDLSNSLLDVKNKLKYNLDKWKTKIDAKLPIKNPDFKKS